MYILPDKKRETNSILFLLTLTKQYRNFVDMSVPIYRKCLYVRNDLAVVIVITTYNRHAIGQPLRLTLSVNRGMTQNEQYRICSSRAYGNMIRYLAPYHLDKHFKHTMGTFKKLYVLLLIVKSTHQTKFSRPFSENLQQNEW